MRSLAVHCSRLAWIRKDRGGLGAPRSGRRSAPAYVAPAYLALGLRLPVAERTRAVQLADAVLRVEVPDAGWQREMRSVAFCCLATLKRYGDEKVERIEFVISQGKQE